MSDSLTLQPIGHLRTKQHVKFHAGHQPSAAQATHNVLELLPHADYAKALRDLAGFDRVWLLWWFHRNPGWRSLVLPPRGPATRRGVFATRSPHRPNALGLSCVPLLGIEGLRLILGPCDLLDGTPVFDLKPYVPSYDAFPEARAGWIDALDAELDAPPKFSVCLAPLAQLQAEWLLAEHAIDFVPRLIELLARDPSPHRTRRIKKRPSGLSDICCGAWRARFLIEGETVTITELEPGFPPRRLAKEGYADIPDRAAQLAFFTRWPEHP